MAFVIHFERNCATLWHTSKTEGATKQKQVSAVYSILLLTDRSLGCSFEWIRSKNKTAENLTNSKQPGKGRNQSALYLRLTNVEGGPLGFVKLQ